MNEQNATLEEGSSNKQMFKSAEPSPPIPIAEPLPGNWPEGAQAFPSSYTQGRLWFLEQLQPSLTAYHLPALWQLSGELDLAALEYALGFLIERHSTLRSSFRPEGSELVQILHPPAPYPLTAEPVGDRDPEAVIEALFKHESSIPFDLTSGVLFRARLLAIESKKHLLLINYHHIALDACSLYVLIRDLSEFYNASLGSRCPQLKQLTVQYQDYAAWQRLRLSGSRRKALKNFWAAALAGVEPLQLSSDHPRSASPSHHAASHSFQIEPYLLNTFEQLCRSEGATLKLGLVAIVALLLHRYSHQHDFAIGVAIWGRSHPDLEPLVGCFSNTLPIRTRFSPELTFRQLLAQVKATSIDAYEHQELPFEQMLEALNLDQDSSRNTLVQVMLQLIELPEESFLKFDGLEVERLSIKCESSKDDLKFSLYRREDGGIQANLVYAKNLFEAERIEHLCLNLIMLINSASQAPDAWVNTLNLLSQVEREQIESWQKGPKMEIPNLCVHQLFEQQVKRNPGAKALVFEDKEITYAELNYRANQLAHHLIGLGVGPEIIVAVYMERSVELVVSLLAILKAGGAYLPLDPEWPEERISFVLVDSDPLALLVHGATLERLGVLTVSVMTIDIDADAMLWSEINSTNPVIQILGLQTNNLAYVIYTSGSTGKPKGVLNAHRGVVNRLLWMQAAYSLSSCDSVLQKTPYSFDVSVWEFFWTLHAGARLVIVSPERHKDPRYLTEIIIREGITTLHFVPSMLKAFLACFRNPISTQIRIVFCSGEALSAQLIEEFRACFPDCELHNLYGPTEAAVDVTAWECSQKNPSSSTVPIGRPISNTRIYLLDGQDSPVPIGVAGELCIGGVQVARGYLNRPDLTADRFLVDPFSSELGDRMYRTGDLARWLLNGNIEYLGRSDFQIKLRGFRIEPGEIEASLLLHPGVSQAVVILCQEDSANPRLIAYWVAESSATSAPPEKLRAFLAERLPGYMVPSAFVELEGLPLTSNGKLDRRALPAPSFAGELQQFLSPSTEIEIKLHEIWAEVLGHSQFGCDDNFWMVGGHSLAAASLIVRIEQTLGRAVAWEVIYRYPTITRQSAWLLDRSSAAPHHLVTLQPQGSRPPLYIVHGWGGRVGSFTHLARALAPDRPVLGLQASPDAAPPPPGTSVAQMTQAYAKEILSAHPGGPIHLMGFSAGGWYAYAVAAALLQNNAQVGVVAVLDTYVTAQIDPRLGLSLLTRSFLSYLRDNTRPIKFQFRWRYLKQLLIQTNSTTGLYLGLRIPAPHRLASWLRGTAPPLGLGEPYVQLLMCGYRPPRLPLVVDLFSAQAHLPMCSRLWRFYALGGVRCWPLFSDHNDYEKPELATQLASALENALVSMESKQRM